MHKGIKFSCMMVLIGFLSCSLKNQDNDFIIDSTRVGDIKLCDNISDVIIRYQNTKFMNFEGDEGVTWKGLKIILPDNEWLLLEASWIDSNRIWRISTNSIKYTTVNGYKVGDTVEKLKKSQDKISYYESEMGFELTSKDLKFGFQIESKFTDKFYKKVNDCNNCSDYINYLEDNATIQEIIISGGCK
jgi:hypothetical protein